MKKILVLVALAMVLVGCKTVTVPTEEEEEKEEEIVLPTFSPSVALVGNYYFYDTEEEMKADLSTFGKTSVDIEVNEYVDLNKDLVDYVGKYYISTEMNYGKVYQTHYDYYTIQDKYTLETTIIGTVYDITIDGISGKCYHYSYECALLDYPTITKEIEYETTDYSVADNVMGASVFVMDNGKLYYGSINKRNIMIKYEN